MDLTPLEPQVYVNHFTAISTFTTVSFAFYIFKCSYLGFYLGAFVHCTTEHQNCCAWFLKVLTVCVQNGAGIERGQAPIVHPARSRLWATVRGRCIQRHRCRPLRYSHRVRWAHWLTPRPHASRMRCTAINRRWSFITRPTDAIITIICKHFSKAHQMQRVLIISASIDVIITRWTVLSHTLYVNRLRLSTSDVINVIIKFCVVPTAGEIAIKETHAQMH